MFLFDRIFGNGKDNGKIKHKKKKDRETVKAKVNTSGGKQYIEYSEIVKKIKKESECNESK